MFENLSYLRKRAGLYQKDVAKELGVSRTTITKWETGAAEPRPNLLPKLAATLGCTLDELLKEVG